MAVRSPALAAELERVLHAFAVERYPKDPSERRALETMLEDLAAPVRASLAKLDAAAGAAAAARDDTVFVRWRAWAAECRALFAQVDRCWLAVAPVLKRTPVAPTRAWRWPWRRGDAPADAPADARTPRTGGVEPARSSSAPLRTDAPPGGGRG